VSTWRFVATSEYIPKTGSEPEEWNPSIVGQLPCMDNEIMWDEEIEPDLRDLISEIEPGFVSLWCYCEGIFIISRDWNGEADATTQLNFISIYAYYSKSGRLVKEWGNKI
jgi:hypothetical protein